jgi:hypothetical protein
MFALVGQKPNSGTFAVIKAVKFAVEFYSIISYNNVRMDEGSGIHA